MLGGDREGARRRVGSGIATAVAMLALSAGAGPARAAVTWSIGDASVAEGNAGPTQMTFTITATGVPGLFDSPTVHYATIDGSATAPGDYAAVDATAAVPGTALGGDATIPVTVDVRGDGVPERDETLRVVLSAPSEGTIADGSGQGTIVNDDPPHLAVADASVSEHDGAAVFTVSLDGAGGVSVHYATADGSALAGSDYTATSGTLTFARADTAKTIAVPILDDAVHEDAEAFSLVLSSPSGVAASGNDLAATAAIADDDAAPAGDPSGPGLTAGSSTGDTSGPHVRLSRPRSRRGAIVVSIACPATETLCRGTLTTFSKAVRHSRLRVLRHEHRLGRATFVIAGGRTASITTRVSKRMRRRLRRARKIRVRSYAVVRDAAGNLGTASAGARLSRLR